MPASLLGRVLVLVAHPDDEAVGCGALLQRMAEPVVVFCTDGAPRDPYFWSKFESRLRCARYREEEARRAMSVIGVNELVFLAEAGGGELFIDQELYQAIPQAVGLAADAIRRYRPQAIITLAYEGGHPDHDACSFIAAVLAREHGLPVWEFPLYHRQHAHATCAAEHGRAGELVYQRFVVPGASQEILLEVTPEEVEAKRQMLGAYSSQHPFLFEFDPAIERFRPQHAYDYAQPPHLGVLNYEAWGWNVKGTDLCAAFQRVFQAPRKTA